MTDEVKTAVAVMRAFQNRRPNTEKLTAFGFAEQEEGYVYTTPLINGKMTLTVTVGVGGGIQTTVTDGAGEEYVLHRVPGSSGAFVGQVRTEYEAVLETIAAACFEANVFQSDQARALIAHVRETYGDELEFLWTKVPDNAVWRRKDTGKWYAALLTVSKRKLGFDEDRSIEILDLRIQPEHLETLIDRQRYFPGYHMNKKHWYTLCLDGSVPLAEICRRMAVSYELAVK